MTHHRKYPSTTPSEGRRVVLWKRFDGSDDDEANLKALRGRVTEQTFKNIFTKGMSANEAERHAIAGATGASLDDVDAARQLQRDEEDNTDTNAPTRTSGGAKHVSSLADLLVEASGGKLSREDALQYLLHSRDGRALSTTHKSNTRKESSMPDNVQTLVKDYGIVAVAKSIVDRGHATAFTEEEFTKAVGDYAQRDRRANETREQAFSRVFTGDDDVGMVLRKACQIVKNSTLMPITPVSVGGDAATDVDDPEDALAQLQALAERLRASSPALSKAQAFAKVFQDPANAALAARERSENRPSA